MFSVKSHSELLAKQYWLSCYHSHHPGHHLTSQPAPARNMKGTLSKFDRDVVPLRDDGISKVEQYEVIINFIFLEIPHNMCHLECGCKNNETCTDE